ncbi:MAG: hypothetical protein NC452_02455 [Eubacterium sp.]|nr:hypothetical protein [Eubacterium sp.]
MNVKNKPTDDLKLRMLRGVTESAIVAAKKISPSTHSNGAAIMAIVYIFTNGNCEITQDAMELVKAYKSDDKFAPIVERLDIMGRCLEDCRKGVRSVELCTCYNTYDRRYGSAERRKSPKETNFREQGNIDMLRTLRRQAEEQRKADNAERGRQIYNQIKNKNDDKDK